MEDNIMELRDLLLWLFAGPGAGIASYYLMKELDPILNALNLHDGHKRIIAFTFTGLIAIIAYAFAGVMLYVELPLDWRGWLEMLAEVAGPAIIASQAYHGYIDLPKKRH
jgi:hypothetical protein